MNFHFDDDYLPEEEKKEIMRLVTTPDHELIQMIKKNEMELELANLYSETDPSKLYELKRTNTILDTIIKCKMFSN